MTLYYDDQCSFCQRSVAWVAKRDTRQQIRLKPLREWSGQPENPIDSVVVVEGAAVSFRSDAVLRVLRKLGGIWSVLAAVGSWTPRRARDALYDAVARRRHCAI